MPDKTLIALYAGLSSAVAILCAQWYRLCREVAHSQSVLAQHTRERQAVMQYLNRMSQPFESGDPHTHSKPLDTIVDFMIEMTQADAGVCYLLHEDDGALWAHSIRGLFPPLSSATPYALTKQKYLNEKIRSEKIELGSGIIGEVALNRQPVLVLDPAHDSRIPRGALDTVPFSNIMVAPLISNDQVLGVLAVVSRGYQSTHDMQVEARSREFTEEDLGMLTALGEQAASTVEQLRKFRTYAKEETERRIMENELALAHEFQQTLLPSHCPTVHGYDIAVFSRAARDVGGDYYDVFWVDDDRRYLGIVMADVSGKGVPGAFVMAMTRTALRVVAKNRLNPLEVMLRVNDRLYEDTKDNVFVTITYGILDTSARRLRYVCCGHEPLIKIDEKKKKIIQSDPDGLALGLMPSADLQQILVERTTPMRPAETMVLYTDGVVEAEDSAGREFGREPFFDYLRNNTTDNPDTLLHNIVNAIDAFSDGIPQHDDITLLAIRFHDNTSLAQATAASIAPV